MLTGGCHCGAVRYRVVGEPLFVGVCHCSDCRHSSGAISVGWIGFPTRAFTVTQGSAVEYVSPAGAHRHFCGSCGTGMFYLNPTFLPEVVDIQLTTLDECDRIVPKMHIQVADQLPWESALGDLPRFDRYPEAMVHYH